MALILNGNGTVDTGTMVFGNGDITGLSAGALPSNVIGAGAVLQVVNAAYSAYTTTSSTTFQDTGLTASITPTSSSSKILVLVSCFVGKFDADFGVKLRLVRGSTEISYFADGVAQTDSTARNLNIGVSHNYLDSPATTSSTTYKVQFANDGGAAGTVTLNWYHSTETTKSTLTLMEIAA